MTTTNTTWFSATTYADVVEVCYRWTICNISFLLKDSEELESSSFKSSENTSWSWVCCTRYGQGYFNLGLKLLTSGSVRKPAEFEFSLIAPKGKVTLAGPYYGIFEQKRYEHYVQPILNRNQILAYKTDPGDTLTIVCRVRALISKETSADTLSIPACKLQDDLQTVLKNQQFTDVTLIVDGHSVKAHKTILAARSHVFAAMFSTDMEENRQNRVTITDMEYEVVQQLLQFINTGKTDIAPKTVDQLLVAADKYGLMRLKAQCEQTILKTLTAPTAIKTLIFADRMNTDQLKSRTMKFIKTNMDKVVESDDWKTMAVDHPTLLVEVCRTLARA